MILNPCLNSWPFSELSHIPLSSFQHSKNNSFPLWPWLMSLLNWISSNKGRREVTGVRCLSISALAKTGTYEDLCVLICAETFVAGNESSKEPQNRSLRPSTEDRPALTRPFSIWWGYFLQIMQGQAFTALLQCRLHTWLNPDH